MAIKCNKKNFGMMNNADLSSPLFDYLFPGSGFCSSDSVLNKWVTLAFSTYVRSKTNLFNSHARSRTTGAAWGLCFPWTSYSEFFLCVCVHCFINRTF